MRATRLAHPIPLDLITLIVLTVSENSDCHCVLSIVLIVLCVVCGRC